MNIHEYQAKQLLARYGVAVPLEIPAKAPDEVRAAAGKILSGAVPAWSSNRKSMPADAAKELLRTVFKVA